MMPTGTLRPSGRIQELKRITTTACLIVSVTALSGCGFLPFGDKKDTQTPAPMPPAYSKTVDSPAIPTGEPPPIQPVPSGQEIGMNDSSSPSGYNQVPVPPPELSPPLDPLVAAGQLQLGEDGPMGSLGVNLDEYFDETETLDKRVSRVERAVTAIHSDLKTLAPPLKRLITVERDIQELVTQLADFVEAPPAPAPAPTPVAYSAPLTAPPANMGTVHSSKSKTMSGGQLAKASGGANISHLRVGEHKDKTRLVLDASAPISYRYDLDNSENLLVIELPGAGWTGKQQETLRKSPIVSSYSAFSAQGGGTRVVIQLKKNTSVSYETVIKPNKDSRSYRIVIDLKK